jgi:hypothetical protein
VAGGRWQEEGIYKGQITIYLYIPQNNIARTLVVEDRMKKSDCEKRSQNSGVTKSIEKSSHLTLDP